MRKAAPPKEENSGFPQPQNITTEALQSLSGLSPLWERPVGLSSSCDLDPANLEILPLYHLTVIAEVLVCWSTSNRVL